MSTIKILLENGETEAEVRDLLLKALTAKKAANNNLGVGESFNDPAMDAVTDLMFLAHDQATANVVSEIEKFLGI